MNNVVNSKVSIKPGINILTVLRHLNYKPWYAIAEFVDNAIQSYLSNSSKIHEVNGKGYRLVVDIQLEPTDTGCLIVRDNAAGIFEKDYARAFRSAEVPPDRSGLSEFGMGMKSASCWFSPRWSVRTTALGEKVERLIKFDIEDIVRDKIEELEFESFDAKADRHFTEIVLYDLFRAPQGRTVGKIKEHLSDIYRDFIRKGILEIRFNNEILSCEEPEILVAPYYKDYSSEPREWKKEVSFDFGPGMSATGFVALRAKGSTTRAGLSLFRRGRVIEGSGDEGVRPSIIFGKPNSFEYQRIFGELHLEGIGVSHTKDGLEWDENGDAFLELLKQEISKPEMPLLQQAREFRSKMTAPQLKKEADRAVERTADAIKEDIPEVGGNILVRGPKETIPDDLQKRQLTSFKEVPLKVRGQDWVVAIELSHDPAVGSLLEISDFNTKNADLSIRERRLKIRVSLAHSFFTKFLSPDASDIEPALRLIASLGLAEVLARDSGVKLAGSIRMNFNEIIGALSR